MCMPKFHTPLNARVPAPLRPRVAPAGRPPAGRPISLAKPRVIDVTVASAMQLVSDSSRLEMEKEARRAEMAAHRAAERAAEEMASQAGLQWWEVDCPANMENVQTLEQLQAAVEGANAAGRLAVVQFFATDCYACKSMQPKMRQIARDNGDVVFCKLNGAGGDELRQYCEDMAIDRIPYFHFYAGGRRVSHFSANMRPEKLQQLRAAIAQHRQTAAEAAAAAAAAAQPA